MKKSTWWIFSLCFLLVSLLGCGFDGTSQEHVIGTIAQQQGEFCKGDQLCISFPANLVTTPVEVSVEVLDATSGSIGPVYRIHSELDTFEKEMELKLLIPKSVGTNKLAVAFWKEGKWVAVPSRLSEDGKHMIGTTNHFSDWSLILDDSTPVDCVPGEKKACGSEIGTCKKGTQACVDGKWSAVCEGEVKPANELCDGLDNDCDGQVDEDFARLGNTCEVKQHGCTGAGTYVCSRDKLGILCDAKVEVKTEVCDGQDNNCDGQTDEGCSCQQGEKRPCGSSVGTCNKGTQACVDGKWSASCHGGKQASSETCDGLDNDCDGQTDEDFAALGSACSKGKGACKAVGSFVCNASKTGVICDAKEKAPSSEVCDGKDNDCDGQTDESLRRDCGTDVGACKKGAQTCSNGSWGTCVGEVKPANETCDGKDNDCDGKTDEDFVALGSACSKGNGACKVFGRYVCASVGTGVVCDAKEKTSSSEVCDGKDNDCDGLIDEGLTQACGSNIGACKKGTQTCSSGTWSICRGATQASPEVCNGKDDNCDGQVDESLTRACGSNTGNCKKGLQACSNGSWGACTGEIKPSTETCNGKDDDCDGQTDEGLSCNCFPSAEICDGKDNDCDGKTDEDLERSCGKSSGGCKGGTQVCANGSWGACTGEIKPSTEVCDDKDNDCDGLIDENLSCPQPSTCAGQEFAKCIDFGKNSKRGCRSDGHLVSCYGTNKDYCTSDRDCHYELHYQTLSNGQMLVSTTGKPAPYYCHLGRCVPKAADTCQKTSDCREAGSLCIAERCVRYTCARSEDCPFGFKCDTSKYVCKTTCSSNLDCQTGYSCLSGKCKKPCNNQVSVCQTIFTCTSKSDCQGGYLCVSGSCQAQPSTCRQHSDCGYYNICVSGKCTYNINYCNNDRDCWNGNTCDRSRALCKSSCQSQSDCASGYICRANNCVDKTSYCVRRNLGCPGDKDYCDDDDDCENNFSCKVSQNRCSSSCSGIYGCKSGFTCAQGNCVKLDRCNGHEDCHGYRCDRWTKKCSTTCRSDSDCRGDHRCSSGACVKAPGGCYQDSDCDKYKCSQAFYRCMTSCTGDYQCRKGHRCSAGKCIVIVDFCAADADCKGYQCLQSSCLKQCTADTDCAKDYRCSSGKCVYERGHCSRTGQCGSYTCDLYSSKCRTSCHMNKDCSVGYICSSGKCITEKCITDHECGAYRCVQSGPNSWDRKCGRTCSSNSDCNRGVCANGECVSTCTPDAPYCFGYACAAGGYCKTSCSSDLDCGEEHQCIQGRCRKKSGYCSRDQQCLGTKCDLSKKLCKGGCSSNSDCQTGFFCSGQKCRRKTCSRSSGNCGTYKCNESKNTCYQSCRSSSECAWGAACVAGKCRKSCESNRTCSGYQCDTTGTCKDTCSNNDECASGFACVSGLCRWKCSSSDHCYPYKCDLATTKTCEPYCQQDSDCPKDFRCHYGECLMSKRQ